MRFDESIKKIIIDLSEFVSISKRAVSPTPSYDEDEVGNERVSARILKRIVGEASTENLDFEF